MKKSKNTVSRVIAAILSFLMIISTCSCKSGYKYKDKESDTSENVTGQQSGSDDITDHVTGDGQTMATTLSPNYVMIPHFIGEDLSVASEYINRTGLEFAFDYVESELPYGHVVDFLFTGSTTDSMYCVDKRCPLMLYISRGVTRSFENVTAKSEKIIYLTFDDGPGEYTDSVLETLEKHDVKATFFTVGYFVSVNPEKVKRIIAEGHKLGCHTQSHDMGTVYKSSEGMVNDIKRWENSVKSALGYLPDYKLFRFPGGSNNAYLPLEEYPDYHRAVFDYGYSSYDWTFANNDRYLDYKEEGTPVTEYLKEMTRLTLSWTASKPEEPKIMLMHDSSKETAQTLDWIITYLKSEGYTFSTLDTLSGDWLFRGR